MTAYPNFPNWTHFPVLALRLEVVMGDRFRLPPFAGSMFRGVLGWALKEVCAPKVYSYLFETASTRPGQNDADWERTSNRQRQRHVMGGLVGLGLYQGEFRSQWLALLTAGEVLNLGKAATFGMGSYRVLFPEDF